MATRLELHDQLLTLCDHVYYQPPETLKMVYPCIVYNLQHDNVIFADDLAYRRGKQYSATVIDRNPDSDIPDNLGDLFGVEMERHYTVDNLHHFSYTINY